LELCIAQSVVVGREKTRVFEKFSNFILESMLDDGEQNATEPPENATEPPEKEAQAARVGEGEERRASDPIPARERDIARNTGSQG
jgi:hypothetical protein